MILVAIEAMGLGIYQGIAISISPQQSHLAGKSAIYVEMSFPFNLWQSEMSDCQSAEYVRM